MVTDLDDNNEYIDVSINSNNVGRCNPTGVTEGSCEWWTCSISPSQTFSTTTSLSVRLKYSKYVGYYENYKCTYNGKTSHAIARVTLTEGKLQIIRWYYSWCFVIIFPILYF